MSCFFSSRELLSSFSALVVGATTFGHAYARPQAQVATVSQLPDGKKVKAVTLTNDHGL